MIHAEDTSMLELMKRDVYQRGKREYQKSASKFTF